jgi:hypothetical protein
MDPVTISAVILAVVSGVATEAGSSLWDGLTALVRRPFHARHPADPRSAPESGGVAELAAVEQIPADKGRALELARVLVARADSDPSFRAELESWLGEASRVRIESGSVTNTISGGSQHGPVLQGRDFSNVTFGAAPAPRGEPRPEV